MKRRLFYLVFGLTFGFFLVLGNAWLLCAQEDDPEAFTLDEITVTAEKRAENLQKVAMSMSVIKGTDLVTAKADTIEDILSEIPSIATSKNASGWTLSIRGIGQDLPPEVGDAAVSFNIDGSHQQYPESSVFGFFDVDQVEVLRGPQGTLYGRSATAGVVNVISAKPKLDTVEGYVSLNASSYNTVKGESTLNAPISDTMAARIGIVANRSDSTTKSEDGWRTNQYALGSRVQVRYEPQDDVFVNLMANYVQRSGGNINAVTKANWDAGKYDINNSDEYDKVGVSNTKQYKLQVNAEAPVGPGIVTFIPTYDYLKNKGASIATDRGTGEVTGVSTSGRLDYYETNTVELRYASKGDSAIKWIGGLYYTEANEHGVPRAPDPTQLKYSEGYAAFGQVTYPFADSFRGIAGVRYNKDKKGYDHILETEPGIPESDSFDFDYFDWKLGFELDHGENMMSYFTVATGHKSGGYAERTGVPFDEESLVSAEYGLKSRFMDQRLQINGDVFYYNYEDYQVVDMYLVDDDTAPGGRSMYSDFKNVDKARSYGSEIEVNAVLTQSTMMNLSVAYLKNEYTSDFYVHEFPTEPETNQKGKPFPRSPKFTVNLGFEQTLFNTGVGSLTAKASAKYTDDQYMGVFISPNTLIPGYTVLNASVLFKSIHTWTLNLYANNLLDEHYVTGGFVMDAVNTDYFPGEPRIIGLAFNMRF